MTNNCTIISQIITFFLHVATLLCYPQGPCNLYLAKLHKYFKCICSTWALCKFSYYSRWHLNVI